MNTQRRDLSYARKLAENMNNGFVIDARVPSVLIAGPANFPARKKEKQNAARDRNMEEWKKIQGLLDRIKSTGTGEPLPMRAKLL